jgi:hypothetical protein
VHWEPPWQFSIKDVAGRHECRVVALVIGKALDGFGRAN